MRIVVWSAKGGAGKTPISTNIALDLEYCLATNEKYNVYGNLDCFTEDDNFLEVRLQDAFPTLPADFDVVFDLAVAIDTIAESIKSAVRQADVIIVPIQNEFKSLIGGISTIRECQPFGKPIIVVTTKLEKDRKDIFTDDWTESADFKNVKKSVLDVIDSSDTDIQFLPLRRSKIFDTIFDEEKSIAQIMEVDPLVRYQQRVVNDQFKAIYAALERIDSMSQVSVDQQPITAQSTRVAHRKDAEAITH